MTLVVHVGRRVPKSWFRRGAARIKGLMTFQENIWQMISQSFKTARKKCMADGRMVWKIEKHDEPEDLNYKLEWIKNVIQGTKEMEEEEYHEALKLYDKMGKQFKKDFDVDVRLAKRFKSDYLNAVKVTEAYSKGYGAMEKKNIVNKLLEMGIMTHIEWIDDFDSREELFF